MVDAAKRLLRCEKEIRMYIFYLHDGSLDDIMFRNSGGVVLRKRVMKTLAKVNDLHIDIMKVWSQWLNEKEQYKVAGSPTRFFVSPLISEMAQIYTLDSWVTFNERMPTEAMNFQDVPMCKIDLFFFPHCIEIKYFIICIDTRKGKIFLLDSTNDDPLICHLPRYNNFPNNLNDMFVTWLRTNELSNPKVKKMANTKINVLQLEWADKLLIKDTT